MNKTPSQIYQVKKPETLSFEKVRALKEAFEFWENQPKTVYNSKGLVYRDKASGYVFNNTTGLLDELYKVGVPTDFSLKEAGLLVEHWFENSTPNLEYSKESVADAARPEDLNQTTISEKTNQEIFAEAEKRGSDIAKTKENAKSDVKRAQDRLKEIYDQQKIIQNQIKSAQDIQSKIEGKKIYAEVELQKDTVLTKTVNDSFETLVGYASYEETRTDLINQLAEDIKVKASADDLFARTAAVQIVNDLASPEAARQILVEAAIQDAISKDQGGVVDLVLQKENAIVEAAKRGAALQEVDLKDSVYLSREISKNIFGEDITRAIYGPDKVKVTLSAEKNDRTTHQLDLGNSNQNYIKSLEEKNSLIDSVRDLGTDKARSVFSNNARSYIAKKAAESPAGIIGKAYSSDAIKGILSNYGLAEKIEWQAYNRFGSTVINYFPESAPYFKLLGEVTGMSVGIGAASKIIPLTYGGGAIPLTKIAYIQQVKSLGVPYTLGTKIGGKFAVGLGARTTAQVAGQAASKGLVATIATTLGTLGTTATFGLSLLAGWVVGKIAEKLPQIKKWFSDNKAVFIGLAAGGGLLIGGPAVGGLVLLGGLAATGSIAAFATGTMGILGYIGSSLGIIIATPVIILFLIVPPLTALTMLIINNSAYVVPPSLNESAAGKITSPYIDLIKTSSPTGPLKNSDLPTNISYTVTIKPKKNTLTSIKIVDSCQVISKSDVKCPSFAMPGAPESLSPTESFTFTYTSPFDSKYKDSVIINTITVTADTIGQSGATAVVSNSVTIGNPPISCPVPGAKPDNSMNYSYNSANDTGHGSKTYWNAMGDAYSYPLPQSTSCFHPGDCPYYGYSYDVFPNGTNEVFAPSVLGKEVTWNCSYAFANGGGKAGYTFHCTSTDGNYLLVLTHMNKNAKTGTLKPGEKIGSLYNQGGNTHLHMEFQLNGQWQKPENYFCK